MIEYSLLLEKFQTLLKENTLKFTKQRELVLKFLYENDGHFTPEDIYNLKFWNKILKREEHPKLQKIVNYLHRTGDCV